MSVGKRGPCPVRPLFSEPRPPPPPYFCFRGRPRPFILFIYFSKMAYKYLDLLLSISPQNSFDIFFFCFNLPKALLLKCNGEVSLEQRIILFLKRKISFYVNCTFKVITILRTRAKICLYTPLVCFNKY